MLLNLVVTTVLMLLTGCATGRASAPPVEIDCLPPPSALSASDSARLSVLAGTFRLTEVLTSFSAPSPGDAVSHATITLALADSLRRAQSRVRRIGYAPRRDLRLIGRLRTSEGFEHPAEVDGTVLYIGCRDCYDASPLVMRVTEVAESGFRGTWRDYQTGIGRAYDPTTGRPTPDPAGHFCAQRQR